MKLFSDLHLEICYDIFVRLLLRYNHSIALSKIIYNNVIFLHIGSMEETVEDIVWEFI